LVRRSEWIAVGYFLYLLLPIWLRGAPAGRIRLTVSAAAAALCAFVLSTLPDAGVWRIVRDWAPGALLLVGYWLPGKLFTAPDRRLEGWLLETDRRWARPLLAAEARIPRWLREFLELSYLLCYPLVPLSFAAMVFWNGDPDDFWATVLLAVFGCYGLLPWLPTRPPRALPSETEALCRPSVFRRLNIAVLGRASIQVNTFPSGHVAAALAAALAVGQVHLTVAAAITLLAVSIAVAAVVGRYHYAADVVLGAAMALIAFAVTR
jgi:hypothetical protein